MRMRPAFAPKVEGSANPSVAPARVVSEARRVMSMLCQSGDRGSLRLRGGIL
jgi:hypothetical protein